jgi:hypothetical protein
LNKKEKIADLQRAHDTLADRVDALNYLLGNLQTRIEELEEENRHEKAYCPWDQHVPNYEWMNNPDSTATPMPRQYNVNTAFGALAPSCTNV